ncbi:hypothetical protein EVAR_54567_1 [Eumeta japonica]|uniref:Uncharacterized protein n=1 Tax=Eumeta variegata TaxID=151549 RepID=A0A4C1YGU8_EUMVA|nr:hypothetical protein EVAR_54567_1 [Eumeta japonica]
MRFGTTHQTKHILGDQMEQLVSNMLQPNAGMIPPSRKSINAIRDFKFQLKRNLLQIQLARVAPGTRIVASHL